MISGTAAEQQAAQQEWPKDVTELFFVIDKSGSMFGTASDVIGGFNNFIAEQKKLPDKACLTLVLFDNGYEIVHERLRLADVPNLDSQTYVPSGGTALLDAVGRTIKNIPQEHGKVIFVIMTDGEENSSREYTLAAVREMIEGREKQGNWETIFIGADQDSFSEAGALGVKAVNTANYSKQAGGTHDAFASVSTVSAHYRAGGTAHALGSVNWRPRVDDEEEKKGKNTP